jgi:hypothetical protein
MGLDLKCQWSGAKKNHLRPGSSEWRRGGGSSPSMGKPEEEEEPCVQLGSESKMGNKRSTQPKNKEKREERNMNFALEGIFGIWE